MRTFALALAALSLAACASTSNDAIFGGTEVATSGGETGSGSSAGGVATTTGTGGFSNAGTGGITTSGGAGTAGGNGTAGVGAVPHTALSGSLAFAADFTGEYYGQLPDGGADLSNLDCRIAEGLVFQDSCVSGDPDAGPNVAEDAGISAADAGGIVSLDGGSDGATGHILDIYVTDLSGAQLSLGSADSAATPSDAGTVATLYLTAIFPDGGRTIAIANNAQVSYQANAAGMSGTFSATFAMADGGSGSLSGTFGAPYCAPLYGD